MTQATEQKVSTKLLARFLLDFMLARQVMILDYKEHYQRERLENHCADDVYISVMCIV